MATNLQTLAYTYSDLAAAANPRLALGVDDPETPLTTATSGGADVGSVLIADVRVSIGESPWWRVTRITVDTYDNTATYTYTQNGTAVATAAAAATLPDFLAAWAAAINANQAAGFMATAEGSALLILDPGAVSAFSATLAIGSGAALAYGSAAEAPQILVTARVAGDAFYAAVAVGIDTDTGGGRSASVIVAIEVPVMMRPTPSDTRATSGVGERRFEAR